MAEQSVLQKFLETLANDSSLQQQLKASTNGLSNEETCGEIVRFAQAQGFEVSASDVQMLRTAATEKTDELSDEQLDCVAGGMLMRSVLEAREEKDKKRKDNKFDVIH